MTTYEINPRNKPNPYMTVRLNDRARVREQPCMVCGNDYGVEAHHLMRPWRDGRGMGMRAGDDNAVPLCSDHHRALHARGDEIAFFEETLGDGEAGQFTARSLWYRSPSYKERS